jgi:hypothetical protein
MQGAKRAAVPFTAIGATAARRPRPDKMDNLLFESPLTSRNGMGAGLCRINTPEPPFSGELFMDSGVLIHASGQSR